VCFLEKPPKPGPNWASVAIVVGQRRILLIRRVEREGDPWSGQMAFPGGMWSNGDESLIDTAVREVREEVGLSLRREDVAYLLTPESPRNAPYIKVLPVVFKLGEIPPPNPNPEEVAEVVLASRDEIREEEVFVGKWTRGFVVKNRYIVWGLTYRILMKFLKCAPNLLDS